MAELITLARPYAKAAFEYAREKAALDQWSSDLATAAAVVQDPKVAPLLGVDADTDLAHFIGVVASNRRLGLIPAIHKLYDAFKANLEASVDVDVTSAYELNEQQVSDIEKALKTLLNKDINVHTKIDDHLIGGVVIRAGDLVIDGSVRESI
jgi:F-type H+-transporting ATPase subunit delta